MLALKNAASFLGANYLARGAVPFPFATILQEHCVYLYQWLPLIRNLAAFWTWHCCFSFQESSVPGGLWWVDHGCGREEHQGPQSSDAAQPISEWQPHGQNPGADLWYMFFCCLFSCSFNTHLSIRWLILVLRFHLATGLTALVSLNVSNSRVSNSGLHHLTLLQNLRSLSLESCRVTPAEIKKLRLAALPNLISVRPEWSGRAGTAAQQRPVTVSEWWPGWSMPPCTYFCKNKLEQSVHIGLCVVSACLTVAGLDYSALSPYTPGICDGKEQL